MKISERVSRSRESGTARIAQIARDLEANGRPVLKLNVGEPDFDTPDYIGEAARKAVLEGKTRYTDVAGTRELREAAAEKFRLENSIECSADNVIVGTGAKQLIFNALLATLDAGDEVIVATPCWVSYPDMVLIGDGTPKLVHCPPETGYKLTAELLAGAITPATRWLIINSPCNPTGAVYSATELGELAEVLRKNPRIAVASDDIYEKITFGGTRFATLAEVAPDLRDRILTVNGVSKSMAMTGWRIGFATGPLELIRAMTKLQSQSTTNASSVGQAAALEALTNTEASNSFVRMCLDAYGQRRDLVHSMLSAADRLDADLPDGAFYQFVDCRNLIGTRTPDGTGIADDYDVCEYFLHDAGVSVVPGSEFHGPGYFRLSFATSSRILAEACKKIQAAVAAVG